MNRLQQMMNTASDLLQSEEFQQFRANAKDFVSARDQGTSGATQITQMTVPLSDVAEVINRSFQRQDDNGNMINVISPVVIPKGGRSYGWVFFALFWAFLGFIGGLIAWGLDSGISTVGILGESNLALALFGPHFWLLWLLYITFSLWRSSYVMVPDGCQALITQYGKLVKIAPAGRADLGMFNFWRRVSYIVNTTKEYPYNAPIREAPTSGRVNASIDLFLQFRIEDPSEFIFTLGGAQGFSEKLQNAVSEVTRALIYEQKAEAIYDLVGESTQPLVDTLNRQFLPAVRFVNANITHAEPSSQQYRMDLAAPEMVRVAKEAYTYEYQLKLRKEQDEGDFNKELAQLQEELSVIRADIASHQAQMDTAREKEVNRAEALASQRLVEAESEARANAALLEAQALDIRAMSSAYFPEILEYRFQQELLNRIEAVADQLPQIINVGSDADETIDFMVVAQKMLGAHDGSLYTPEDLQFIRERTNEIVARVRDRSEQINKVMDGVETPVPVLEEEQSNGNEHAKTRILKD
ncbi:MAG: SPFH domain-containing protein [Chloroflexaceae bacterium]|nr:SPFH domain-containing protein [Chloroflexaceae bacterium]NJO05037.1 SPFH domain-containing protein [Chloroflexaceae bacterium]